MSMLACRALRVRRTPDFELSVPELELDAGTITAAAGPNGSGKSTLLLACAGLLDVAAGRVDLEGSSYHQGRAPAPAVLRQRVVLVHQDPYLFKGTVRRNLSWGMRLRRIPVSERRRRSADILTALGLEGFAEQDVGRLSGGQRTLVAVARALVLEPAVLLLDEVTQDLDVDHRRAVIETVEKYAANGTAVLVATHDREIADTIADQRVSFADGEVTEMRSST